MSAVVECADERVEHARPAVLQPWCRWRTGVAYAVVVAVARLLIARLPLTPDEGGYLLAASQWHHGTSTYGNYFVDRPPLLMAVYALAGVLGGGLVLRLLGVVAAVAAVLVAGRIAGRAAAAAVAVLVVTPLFGTTNVDGELLALPFILAGLLALLRAVSPIDRPSLRAGVGAGVLAMAAMLIKQNMLDVFVAAASVCVVLAANRHWRSAARLGGSVAAGALAAGAVALSLAWARGTSPAHLWDALVTFRFQAGSLISAQGSAAGGTAHRLHQLLRSLVLSGAPFVGLVALVAAGRPALRMTSDRPWRLDLRWVALPVIGWEAVGVVLGGSYWLHYLIALIPGLVLLLGAVRRLGVSRQGPRVPVLLGTSLLASAISATIAFVGVAVHQPQQDSDARIAAYLSAHRQAGDTVVVAFGHPNIVYDAGMTSPYEHLWSLSARVRDPRLLDLTRLMDQPRPPQWVVVAGASLGTWGVDATAADQALHRHYRAVAAAGDWHIFERD
ncbi:glycosyltransferase family 39 protein [Nocardioides sp. BP30]|uniref:glycosyltransferase family 39 protein n=1 Tax=Nocardioides sp. BP30 TaxID=3036374 RepID=UPI00246994B4|nr:glycosyltransferase family 39 protein [Nocardioides sp. BP30]WGL52495.1 glycosyltransferase family 39 protein [Nocardioides sp. BP30]